MFKRMSIKKVIQTMRDIHKSSVNILSNYYNSYSADSEEIEFDCLIGSSTIVFCIREISVYRVFFYSGDEQELTSCLKEVPSGSILDIVDKTRASVYNYVLAAGFYLYTTYIRFGHSLPSYEKQLEIMKTNLLDQFYDEEYGKPANTSDIPEIQKLIQKHFDPKTDHLFTDSKMKELIREGSVFVERDEESIYCVLIARTIGKKIYMNLIVNEGSADVSYSMEKKAVLNAIANKGVNYEYAWIDERNKKALKRCLVQEDNLYNHIYERR